MIIARYTMLKVGLIRKLLGCWCRCSLIPGCRRAKDRHRSLAWKRDSRKHKLQQRRPRLRIQFQANSQHQHQARLCRLRNQQLRHIAPPRIRRRLISWPRKFLESRHFDEGGSITGVVCLNNILRNFE